MYILNGNPKINQREDSKQSMDYRILELVIPSDEVEAGRELVNKKDVLGIWSEKMEDGYSRLRILMDAERTEAISDALSDKFSDMDGFNIMLFSVEAVLPQPENESDNKNNEKSEEEPSISGRVSREELYSDISGGSKLNAVYVGTVILSALVASVGLLQNDVTVIIGAMVIAPLLGPNVSMALAATLADLNLGVQALKSNMVGLFSAFLMALLMGLIFKVDPGLEQIQNRTVIGPGDVAIALAAGSAGVMAFTRGVSAVLIGVMVAVALLPPLVSVGLLLGAGYFKLAVSAAILTVTNLICINLAGIITFLMQGIRPRNWWEAEKAKKASRYAISTWVILLLVFSLLIWFWGK